MSNRRRHKRLSDSCNIINIRYRLGLRFYKKDSLSVIDISGGGIRLCLCEKLKPGTIIDMYIKLAGDKETIPAKGEVIWSHQLGKTSFPTKCCYETGIIFTEIDPLSVSKIYTYFKEHNLEIKLT